MASKDSANKDVQFSAREMEILAKAWQCFDDLPRIDFVKLAEIAAFKNAASARACFLPIKKKLITAAGGPSQGQSSVPSTPTKGRGKRSLESNPGSNKKPRASAKLIAIPDVEEDDDEDVIHARLKAELKAKIDQEKEDEMMVVEEYVGWENNEEDNEQDEGEV